MQTNTYTQITRKFETAVVLARMMRIAEPSKEALTPPKASPLNQPSQGARWGLTVGGAALAVLVVAAWFAGHAGGAIDEQRLSADLNHITEQAASTQLRLDQQIAKTRELENALQSSGRSMTSGQPVALQRRLLQAQAEADQYRAIFSREQQAVADNTRLLSVLSNPGAHLLTMKGSDAAANSTAYAIFVEKSRLLFIGSNLPKPAEGRQFQLWVVRKEAPKVVSAGVFRPDDQNRALIAFDESSVLSNVSVFRVTDEPKGGSPAPTGTKLLEGVLAED